MHLSDGGDFLYANLCKWCRCLYYCTGEIGEPIIKIQTAIVPIIYFHFKYDPNIPAGKTSADNDINRILVLDDSHILSLLHLKFSENRIKSYYSDNEGQRQQCRHQLRWNVNYSQLMIGLLPNRV